MIEIVVLNEGELDLCKELRLRALKDAPGAFADTLGEAITRNEDYWQGIVDSLTPPSQQRMFIAKESKIFIGSVFALLDREDHQGGRLGGMWVDSGYRKKGIGRALFGEMKTWAIDLKLKTIKLWVEDSDRGPRLFYANLGFIETGVKDSSKAKSDKILSEMMLKVQ